MKNLVLSGGGIKGIAQIGALKALEEKNMLEHINNYCGTSIGSFIVLMLCIGYKYNDIWTLFKLDLNKFYNVNNIFNFFEDYSLLDTKPVQKLLKLIINEKYNKNDITFKELYDITKKTLNIYAINITKGIETNFNYINTPNISVLEACIASSSVPFIFPPRKIEDNLYVDALIVNNYPCCNYCDDIENTIGIDISYIHELDNKIDSIETYIQNLFLSFQICLQKKNVKKLPKINIYIQTNINPLDFDIDNEKKNELFNLGYHNANLIIDKYLFEKLNKT